MLAMTLQKVELTVGQISLNSGIAFMVRLRTFGVTLVIMTDDKQSQHQIKMIIQS